VSVFLSVYYSNICVVNSNILCCLNRCGRNSPDFERLWKEEKQVDPSSRLVKSALLRTMLRYSFWYLFPSAPLMFVQNVSQLALPFLIGPIIKFMDDDSPLFMGYVYSGCLFAALMIMTSAENAYFDICVKTGVKLRAGLIPLIYRHAMRMSSEARQERSVGAITNYMSSDTEKIQLFCMSINNLWSAPFRLGLGLYLLISSLGIAGIFGLISVVILIPIQGKVMAWFTVALREVMKRSDARIKILNEVLGGMRVIKYYAWEGPLEERVKSLRKDELDHLAKAQSYRALNLFFINLNPVALSVGTFIAFAAFRGNIDAAQAFQALALFNLLLWPLMFFPRTISDMFEAMVSVDRIEGYLRSATIDDVKYVKDEGTGGDEAALAASSSSPAFVRIADAPPSVSLQSASFTWSAALAPQLIDVTLDIVPGELIAIVGQTGSGKLASAV
jgi:ABC-type multidrug transport system fused ATPase/permease subunit